MQRGELLRKVPSTARSAKPTMTAVACRAAAAAIAASSGHPPAPGSWTRSRRRRASPAGRWPRAPSCHSPAAPSRGTRRAPRRAPTPSPPGSSRHSPPDLRQRSGSVQGAHACPQRAGAPGLHYVPAGQLRWVPRSPPTGRGAGGGERARPRRSAHAPAQDPNRRVRLSGSRQGVRSRGCGGPWHRAKS